MKINWYRLFGLLLMDYFSTRGFNVELEMDLSVKRQYLDVVIVEQNDKEADLLDICDGFDNLRKHNLLSYKSNRQSLNSWAMEELIGHYVNYRKVCGLKAAISEDIQLYAVSTRYPEKLFSEVLATEVTTGVFEIKVISREIRILVLSRLPLSQRNAVLAFFSFDPGKVLFALENYRWQMDDGSTVINQLLQKYSLEGIAMPYTMEQFRIDYVKAHLRDLDPEDRLKGLSAEEILSRSDAEEILSRFGAEDRLKWLGAEEILSRFGAEDRLKGLEAEEIEAYLNKLKKKKRH